MSGTWYPRLQDQIDAERQLGSGPGLDPDEEHAWAELLWDLAADGNVDGLTALRDELELADVQDLAWSA